jgi:hypothetical protein
MQDASDLRSQAELCLQITRAMSDHEAAEKSPRCGCAVFCPRP